MELSKEDITHAGAYRVCLERFDPDSCVSRSQLNEIDQKAVAIVSWAETQPDEIRQAYIRAVKDVRKRAADRLENHERALACISSYQTIPKPP